MGEAELQVTELGPNEVDAETLRQSAAPQVEAETLSL